MLERKIFPSLLSANFLELEAEIRRLGQGGADGIHLDVMDGHFVQNLTFGLPIIRQIRRATSLTLDGHLMISNPDQWVDAYCDAGLNYLSVHCETTSHLDGTLNRIKKKGVKAGVALNPGTNPRAIADYIFEQVADYVLLMTVNPGFGNQKFIPGVLGNIRYLRDRFPNLDIEVDGGIHYKSDGTNNSTAHQAAKEGANLFVAGSATFNPQYKDNNYQIPISLIRRSIEEGINSPK